MALVRGGPRRARVITITPVRVLSVAREHVDPELTTRLSSLWE